MDVPIIVVNRGGFYESLLNLINDLIKQGAVSEGVNKLYEVITEVNEETIAPILDKIK